MRIPKGYLIASLVLLIAAVAWGANVVRQALESDDGGPAMGALCISVPAVLLLVAAGAVWELGLRARDRTRV